MIKFLRVAYSVKNDHEIFFLFSLLDTQKKLKPA